MRILRQKEFGRTGLTAEQAKKFFTPSGNKKVRKETRRTLDLLNGYGMVSNVPKIPIAKLAKRGMKAPQIATENTISIGRIKNHVLSNGTTYPETIHDSINLKDLAKNKKKQNEVLKVSTDKDETREALKDLNSKKIMEDYAESRESELRRKLRKSK